MKQVEIKIIMPTTWWRMLYKYMWQMEGRLERDKSPLSCAVDVVEREIKKKLENKV